MKENEGDACKNGVTLLKIFVNSFSLSILHFHTITFAKNIFQRQANKYE